MPYSDDSNIPYVLGLLDEHQPHTVLDVGAGAGKYGRLVRQAVPTALITALEVWEPYVEQFRLDDLYNAVIQTDVRQHPNFSYDLVIFGDVLEHMTRAEAVALWEKTRGQAKAALISLPIIHYPQGEIAGNPFERHVEENWTHADVLAAFGGITACETYEITGTYLGEFDKEKP